MKISINRKIGAPAEELWKYLGDFSNIHRFHPLLQDSNFIEGAETCEIGSTRQCDFKDGNYIKERITDLKEGSHYTVNIYEGSMPFNSAQATLGLRKITDGLTEAYMDMEFEPRNKLMAPMMWLAFRFQAMPKILRGLERLYRQENGQKKLVFQA